MKGLAKSSPFHLLTSPHVINRFIFGHGVVIYCIYILGKNANASVLKTEKLFVSCFLKFAYSSLTS